MAIAALRGAGCGGSREAIRTRRTSKVTGLSLPNMNKPYVKDGVAGQRRALEHN